MEIFRIAHQNERLLFEKFDVNGTVSKTKYCKVNMFTGSVLHTVTFPRRKHLRMKCGAILCVVS